MAKKSLNFILTALLLLCLNFNPHRKAFGIDPDNIYLPVVISVCPEASLSGVVFHDLNGDGILNPAYAQGSMIDHSDGWLGSDGPFIEQPIPDASISVGTTTIKTTNGGEYRMCLSSGHYEIKINAFSFMFYFPSDDKVVELSKTINVDVKGNQVLNLGLGKGLFTLPYSVYDAVNIKQEVFTDIDPVAGEIGVYNTYPCTAWYCEDSHRGVDYYIPAGYTVKAVAPGFIYSVGSADDGSLAIIEVFTNFAGLVPWTKDEKFHWSGQGIEVSYQHLSGAVNGITPGVFVKRGQPLAYISQHNHLHIDARQEARINNGYVDFYKDSFHLLFVLNSWKSSKLKIIYKRLAY
jgi:hypothetical protein